MAIQAGANGDVAVVLCCYVWYDVSAVYGRMGNCENGANGSRSGSGSVRMEQMAAVLGQRTVTVSLIYHA